MGQSTSVDALTLTDGTITLRVWSLDDVSEVHRMVQDPEIPRFMAIPANQTIEGTADWIGSRAAATASGDDYSFAVEDAATGALLGAIGVERSKDDAGIGEIGYWVAAEARGQGVAQRSVRLVSGWAFEAMALQRLEITAHPHNSASRRVAEACGFEFEGIVRAWREHHGVRVDLAMYSLLRQD